MADVETTRICQALLIADGTTGVIEMCHMGDQETLEIARDIAVANSKRWALSTDHTVIYDPAAYTLGAGSGGGGPSNVEAV